MAATAQDSTAPLRGGEKKDEDRDEDSALGRGRSTGVMALVPYRARSGRMLA
jgi:hypothetical protein